MVPFPTVNYHITKGPFTKGIFTPFTQYIMSDSKKRIKNILKSKKRKFEETDQVSQPDSYGRDVGIISLEI